MTDFNQKLKQFLHDPVDKVLDIPGHKNRARTYTQKIGITWEDIQGPDWIASSMERSLLPKDTVQIFNEIRHPLSDEKIEVGDFDKNSIFSLVEDTFAEIGNKIILLEDRKKFLYLWRNILEELEERFNANPFKRYLFLLPADTRIPDHPIWEHLKIASAINAFENYQNNSLFLFTIGPVQSFISQARKAQDLFVGSFLLSYLSFIAMEEIISRFGPANIIYPDLFRQPLMDWYLSENGIEMAKSSTDYIDQPTIPNRFVAIIPETDKEKIGELGNVITDNVRNEWRSIVSFILGDFDIKINGEMIESQIKNFPEVYWVAIPLRKGERDIVPDDLQEFFEREEIERWNSSYNFVKENWGAPPNVGLIYQLVYTALEKSMGIRKNLRDFKQTEEYGKKCHLCGERGGVIDAGKVGTGKYMDQKEHLCVLCFAKRGLDKYLKNRFGRLNISEDFNFPSTAEVALTDFKETAIETAKDEFVEYINEIRSVIGEKFNEIKVKPLPGLRNKFKGIDNIEGEWFFEENLTKKQIEKQLDIKLEDETIEKLKSKLRGITGKVGEPNPYYAILLLDADNMGKWLSGELLPRVECAYNTEVWSRLPEDFKKELPSRKILTPAIHSTISTALRNYSIEFVGKIIEKEHYGKLIYSGGDDVLAFVNLKDLFEVLRKLRASFSGHIKYEDGQIRVDWGNTSGFVEMDGNLILTMGKDATASCGVVIAHYKTPLKIVLDKVREVEEEAKEMDKKDAFAIALLKHSGEERIGKSKWRCKGLDVLEKLKELGKYLQKRDGSPWISKRFIYNLSDEFIRLKVEDGGYNGYGPVFNDELKRLIKRASHGEKKKDDMISEISEFLIDLFWDTGGNIDNFVYLLEITAFISGAED